MTPPGDLVPSGPVSLENGLRPGELSPDAAAAVAAGIPASTRRAYEGDWRRFASWCSVAGRVALPASAETVTEYATHLAYGLGLKPATIDRALSSIRVAHRSAGETPPDLIGARKVLAGYTARLAHDHDPRARPRRAAAAVPGSLRAMVTTLDPSAAPQ
ncbi:MAG: putative integrase/recombinase [Actinoallomurus sp.]|nr:putative integrase/recombinase [Actinoallomurus sp.]